jgi:hypothetical protein
MEGTEMTDDRYGHGPMIKVRCEYEDGNDWFELYTEGHAKAGLTYVEIREDEWQAYRKHRVDCRLWGNFIREKSNEQYEKGTK